MACIRDYFRSGVENAVSGLISRIGNDYREGFSVGDPCCKKVMRETFKFLSVLQLCLNEYKTHQRISNKCMLYGITKDFKRYMLDDEFQTIKELSSFGCLGIMTPHMIESLEWLIGFCDLLTEDIASSDPFNTTE